MNYKYMQGRRSGLIGIEHLRKATTNLLRWPVFWPKFEISNSSNTARCEIWCKWFWFWRV